MITLCVMAKNEQNIIGRMISSCVGVVDAVALADTGSTDGTIESVREVCRNHNLPLIVREDNFVDFSHNRNLALDNARSMAQKLATESSLGMSEQWILLMDADHVFSTSSMENLKTSIPFNGKSDAETIAYYLKQKNGFLEYQNIRLVRADIIAHYEGRTHEYINVNRQQGSIKTIIHAWINDINDGGCKSDKSVRDKKMLFQELNDNPKNTRSMFYLANTLRDMGLGRDAEYWYEKRIKSGGWEEETYIAALERARLCLKRNAQGSLESLWALFASRPDRSEPLANICWQALNSGDHKRAVAIARLGTAIPMPKDGLFIESNVYAWQFHQALAIGCYKASEIELGRKTCDYLHFEMNSPYKYNALQNAVWYAQKLDAEAKPFPFTPPDGYVAMNPSIARMSNGNFFAIIRCVDFRIDGNGIYHYINGSFRTRNFALEYSDKFEPKGQAVELEYHSKNATNIGPEDCRIFQVVNGQIKVLATVAHEDERGIIQSLKVHEITWSRSGELISDHVFESPRKHEKNWLPITGSCSILYDYGTVLGGYERPIKDPRWMQDLTSDKLRHQYEMDLSGLRGGSSLVKWYSGDGWIYVAHEVCQLPGQKKRTYLHRFVHMDSNVVIQRMSHPFYFCEKGIEFCSGLERDVGELILSFGVNDAKAMYARIGLNKVEEMLSEGVRVR